jgi:hypothetical protein
VPGDQLIGDIVQVVANDVRLRGPNLHAAVRRSHGKATRGDGAAWRSAAIARSRQFIGIG